MNPPHPLSLYKNTAGNRLAATIKYLRGAAGIGIGTTIKVVPPFFGPA
jgi:hypothetical protein